MLPDISQHQGLFNSKVAACATDEFVHQVLINELKTVAKSVSLANCRLNPHRAAWKREAQFHNFATSIARMAAIPNSLMSMVCPFSMPLVRELIVISISILNRG